MQANSENDPHDSPEDAGEESASGPLPSIDSGVIVDEQGNPYRHKKSSYQKFKSLVKSINDRIPHGDRLMIFLTAIIALSAISQIVVSCNNSRSTTRQVDRLIGSAEKIRIASEKFSSSAEGINQGIQSAVGKLQSQADKMDSARTSADKDASDALMASQADSQKSLQASIDNFHQDQRAWLSVEPATGIPNDSKFKITFPISNSGRTPAKNVLVYFTGRILKPGDNFAYTFFGAPMPMGYVTPGHNTSLFEFNGDQSVARADVKGPGEGYIVYGAITYQDVFGEKHWLTYCFFNKEGESYVYCPNHNQMGDGPLPESELK